MKYDLNYNYVFFGGAGSNIDYDKTSYYSICMADLDDQENVIPVHLLLQHLPRFLRILFRIHCSKRINNLLKLPLKKIWYPFYFKNTFKNEKPICFVVSNRILPISYIKYLKCNYPNSKCVLFYRDLRFVTEKSNPSYVDNPIFDIHMTIDENEAKKYGYTYCPEFHSKIDVPISENYPLSDVFFAGVVKDRLPQLLEAYEILSNYGLKCSFYLTQVSESDKVYLPGIEYAEKNMSYLEMLYRTVNTRCILEINRLNAVGYTSRFLESVMYNKKLITNNSAVKKSKFYNPEYIQFVSDIKEIDPKFVSENIHVDHFYNGEFSPLHTLKFIDDKLSIK